MSYPYSVSRHVIEAKTTWDLLSSKAILQYARRSSWIPCYILALALPQTFCYTKKDRCFINVIVIMVKMCIEPKLQSCQSLELYKYIGIITMPDVLSVLHFQATLRPTDRKIARFCVVCVIFSLTAIYWRKFHHLRKRQAYDTGITWMFIGSRSFMNSRR